MVNTSKHYKRNIMNNKLSKNIKVLMGLVLVATVLASCSRGGYGCPYELEVAVDVVNCLVN